jgi:hypothetical protein
MKEKMVILGTATDENGASHQIGVPLADLTTHGFMFGTTGSGKSTALRNLALQTFDLGASTAILEPHGDLCEDMVSDLPDSALDQVVYLAFDGPQLPSIPLMTLGLGGGVDVAVGAAMSVMRMAEPASWDQSTRMREVLRHTSRVILDAFGWQASLLALDRFLTAQESKFRERILSRVSDENSRSRDFCRYEIAATLDGEKKGGAGMRESILGAQRRLEIFVTDRRFRRSLALPPLGPRINISQMLAGRKLLLLPVNKAELGGKVSGLVSMLFMQMVQTAFLSRTDRSQRNQAVIIIDEFAAMAGAESGGSEVAEITNVLLAEARKFGASVILATQSAEQLGPDVRKKVAINTNLKMILLVSDPGEASQAATILGSDLVNETDIRAVPRFHGYIRAMVHKSPKDPCLLQMLPPVKLEGGDRYHAIPDRPDVSSEWEKVRELARDARDPDVSVDNVPVIAHLRNLPNQAWGQVVKDAMAWNRYQAGLLLIYPEREPNRVERAKKISRALYGLPWWLREAHYWRELNEGKRQPGRPRKKR